MANFCNLGKIIRDCGETEKRRVVKLVAIVAEISRILISKTGNKRVLAAICDGTSVARVVCFKESLFPMIEQGHLVRILNSMFVSDKQEFIVGDGKC
jgi:hypothetical protein